MATEITENQTLILIDTLANTLTERADVFLPAATWAEKSGTFENFQNKLQLFEQAIQPIGESLLKEKLILLKTDNILIAADGSLDSSSLNKILLILSDSKIKNVTLLSNTNE
jgi:NADH dehydrogenase/NADH:ubiquinone oxidoreductase subunit G